MLVSTVAKLAQGKAYIVMPIVTADRPAGGRKVETTFAVTEGAFRHKDVRRYKLILNVAGLSLCQRCCNWGRLLPHLGSVGSLSLIHI